MIRQRRVRAVALDSFIQRQLECRALLSTVPVAVGAAGQPAQVSADLNGDGKADLVSAADVILPGTKTPVCQLSVQLGNGDGTFGPAGVITLSGPVSAITTGDFNGSSHADIVCLGGSSAGGGVPGQSVCYVVDVTNPQNDLTIGLPSEFPTAHVAVADMNGDGVPDIVGWNDAVIGVEFGTVVNGMWQGTQPGLMKNPFGPGQLQDIGDLNGDGFADAVLNVNGQLGVAYGHGQGRRTWEPFAALADLPVGSGPAADGIDLNSFSWGATNTASPSSTISADRESSAPSISEITAGNTAAGVTVGFTDSNESVALTVTKEIDRASPLVVTKSTDASSTGLYRTIVTPGPNGGLLITFTDGRGGQVSMAIKSQGVPERPGIAVKTEGDGVKLTFTGANGQTDNILFQVLPTGVNVGLTESGTQVFQCLVQGAGTTAAHVVLNVNDGVDAGTCTLDFAQMSTTHDSAPGVQIDEQIGGGSFGTVDVALGDPAAQFGSGALTSPTGPIWTSQFAIGDVNGDGIPDLVYLGSRYYNKRKLAELFLSAPVSSTGTAITPDRESSAPCVCDIVAAPPGTVAMFVGDLNGDGVPDIFAVSAQGQATIVIRPRGVPSISE